MAKPRVRGVIDNGLVTVGGPAPDFELPALIGGVRKSFRLADYRGRTVVLAFYPFNWQEDSVRQMKSYQSQRSRLLAGRAETVGITVESIMNTTAWERAHGPFDFPLCSDFWPHGQVSRSYGMLQDSGASERGVVVVNPEGQVVLWHICPPEETPALEEVFPLIEGV